MTYWTETAIAQHLDGRFYQLQQKSLGSFAVVDLNEPDDEPEPAPAKLVPVVEPPVEGRLWLEDIGRVVCAVYGITKLELKSPRRNVNIVAARQVFFWLAKRFTSNSFSLIGAWCGHRDHTTVLHGVGKIDRRFNEYAPQINECLSRLGISLEQEAA